MLKWINNDQGVSCPLKIEKVQKQPNRQVKKREEKTKTERKENREEKTKPKEKKTEEKKQRRNKTERNENRDKKMRRKKKPKNGDLTSFQGEGFDSNSITPGTEFMEKVSIWFKDYITSRTETNPTWKNVSFFLLISFLFCFSFLSF